MRTESDVECIQGRRIAKGLAQVAFHSELWRKIHLFKELRGDGNTAGGLDLPQRVGLVVVAVEMLVIGVA